MDMAGFGLSVLWAYVLIGFSQVDCYPYGAPSVVCVSMSPSHGQDISPQTTAAPFTITAGNTYYPGYSIQVTISGVGADFRGYFLQARKKGSTDIVGSFSSSGLPNSAKLMTCPTTSAFLRNDNAVTQTDNSIKAMVKYTWEGPDVSVGEIEFVATIVQTQFKYWKQVKSTTLAPAEGPPPSSAYGVNACQILTMLACLAVMIINKC